MAARLFQSVKRELVNPLVHSRKRMATDSSSSGSSSSSSSSGGSKGKGLSQNEQRVQTALKALAVFLPGVYIGYICTDQGIFQAPEDPEKKQEGEQQEGEQQDGEQQEGEQSGGEQKEGEQQEGEQQEGEQKEGEQQEGEQKEEKGLLASMVGGGN